MVDERPGMRGTPAPRPPRPAHAHRSETWRLIRVLLRTGVRWGRVTFFRRDTDTLPWAPILGGPYAVEEVGRERLRWLADGANPAQRVERLAERFARGDRCFVAVASDGRPVHVRWVTLTGSPIPEIKRELVLEPGDAYFYDGYTRPEARGQGVDGLVRCGIFHVLATERIGRVWSYVRSDNPAGLRAASRWQARAGSLAYVGIRGLRPLCWRATPGEIPALVPYGRAPRHSLSPPKGCPQLAEERAGRGPHEG